MDLGKCPAHNRVLISQLSTGTNDLQFLIDSSQRLLRQRIKISDQAQNKISWQLSHCLVHHPGALTSWWNRVLINYREKCQGNWIEKVTAPVVEMRPEGWVGPDVHGFTWVMVGGFGFSLRTVNSVWRFLKRRSWETDSSVEENQSVCRCRWSWGTSRLEVR